jgi:hypothetical protein
MRAQMRTHSLLAGHRTRTPDSLSPGTGRCPPLTVVSRSSSRPCVSSPSSSQLRAPHLVFVSFFTLLVQHDVRPAVSAPPSPPPLPPSFRLASLGPETKVPHGVPLSRTLELSNTLSNSVCVLSKLGGISFFLVLHLFLSLSFSPSLLAAFQSHSSHCIGRRRFPLSSFPSVPSRH